MEEELYEVLDGNTVLGSKMNLVNAVILLKGYFEEYYNEPRLAVTIQKMARTERSENREK